MRFDDIVRTERYFTATLLPLLLFHNKLEGVQRFVKLIDDKATKEHDKDGKQVPKGTPEYKNFEDVEVITEFHIAQDLKFAGRNLFKVEPSEEGEQERKDAPDVIITAGQELVVCEGKFFMFFSDSDADDLNEQLESQRRQVRYLFLDRPSIRAYRHVAILPFVPRAHTVAADVVITWCEIGNLAEELIGQDHYVTIRLRNAVDRHNRERGEQPPIGKLSFNDMREKCRELGNKILVGHWEGQAGLLKMSLLKAEKKQWKWIDPEMGKGHIVPGHWLSGERWLEIVESAHGFGGRGA